MVFIKLGLRVVIINMIWFSFRVVLVVGIIFLVLVSWKYLSWFR